MAASTVLRPPAAAAPGPTRTHPGSHPLAPERRRLDGRATAALAVVGALGGTVTGLGLLEVLPLTPGNAVYGASVMAAVIGTYGTLLLLLLIARLPILERAYGQDRLVAWHKTLAPWSLALVGLHIVLVVAAYAADFGTGWWAQLANLVTGTPWILPTLAGTLALAAAGLTSWKRARKRMRYGTWWTIHLYTYLGVLLAFAHQITSGGPFLSGAARALWIGLYVAVFGAILVFRVLTPLVRSRRHRLAVESVVRESPDVVSVVMRGRGLERLRVAPGQFFSWRFDAPGLAYEAHPYSVSGLAGERVRITVKALGDSSAALAALAPGTRVGIEGPYGAMTPTHRTGSRVVAIAGGVGIAPIAALADALAGTVPLDVVYRTSTTADLALADEITGLRTRPGVRVHLLAGSRATYPLVPAALGPLVGRLEDADVYLCGPAAFNRQAADAVRGLGARPGAIHSEDFEW